MVVAAKPEAARESKPLHKNTSVRFCLSTFTLGKQAAGLAKVSEERRHSKFYSYRSRHGHRCPVTTG